MFNYNAFSKHTYTLAVEGLNVRDGRFATRQAANNEMYAIVGKYGLRLVDVWDDHHFKTYIFSNGVRIHINREQDAKTVDKLARVGYNNNVKINNIFISTVSSDD